MPYFGVTTTIAVVLGIAVSTMLRPGNYIDDELLQSMVGDTPHTVTSSRIGQQNVSLPQRIVRMVLGA